MNAPGISSLGLAVPDLAIALPELAVLRGIAPDKCTIGLGCHEMALCGPDTTVVDLATRAAERALADWDGELGDLGMIAIGTETAADMSRPLSAYVAERLGLRGAVRSYEVKHACYGGTLALRQATEWIASGASAGKSALVIAADIARYAPGSPAEPTQGAGAVAMVVGEPRIARIGLRSHAYSAPAFDFWRPVGNPWPEVAGKLSLDCFNEAVVETFGALVGNRDPLEVLQSFEAACFHVPFPKMVDKAVRALGRAWEQPDALASWYASHVEPTMAFNRRIGNAYTASLWIAVARALAGRREGASLLAFSYGSGFGAELLTLEAGPDAAAARWLEPLERDLAGRRLLDGSAYDRLRQQEIAAALSAA